MQLVRAMAPRRRDLCARVGVLEDVLESAGDGPGSATYDDNGATLDDLREAVATFEEIERIARRVYGGAHPLAVGVEYNLREARAALRARETPEALAQDAFRTARAKLAQERAELAQTLADASERPPK